MARNLDGLGLDRYAIYVEGPAMVRLLAPVSGHFQQRLTHIRAVATPRGFAFGEFHQHEAAMIGLQASFVETPALKELLLALGNIRDEAVKTHEDDGVTQVVTSRAGLVLASEVKLPRIVELQPYRTFGELSQPPSRFLLRLQKGREGSHPQVGLWEADGGAWRIAAIMALRAWLEQNLAARNVLMPIFA